MTRTGNRWLRAGLEFAKQHRWRIGVVLGLVAVTIVGDIALHAQDDMTQATAVNHEGSRVLVEDDLGDGRRIARVLDGSGQLIHKLGEIPWSQPPIWCHKQTLIWIEELPTDRWAVCKLDFTKKADVVELLRTSTEVLFAFEDDTGRLFHAELSKGSTDRPSRDSIVVYENVRTEVARLPVDKIYQFRVRFRRDVETGPRFLVLYETFAATSSYGGRTARLEFSPAEKTFTWLPSTHQNEFPRSPHHRVIGSKSGVYLHHNIVRTDGGPEEYPTADHVPEWLEGNTFFGWNQSTTRIQVYRPNETAQEIRCGQLESVLPKTNGRIYVSTRSGMLQLIDTATGSSRTIRDISLLRNAMAVVTALGLTACIAAWTWLPWYQRTSRRRNLTPLTDCLVILCVLGFILWFWMRPFPRTWQFLWLKLHSAHLVVIWTLISTLCLFATNRRSVLGQGSIFLISGMAAILFLFRGRYAGQEADAAVIINGTCVFVGVIISGMLVLRGAFGRLHLGFEREAKRQVSLKQVASLTFGCAAMFSVMRFYNIHFTLEVNWVQLVSFAVFGMTVCITSWSALAIRNPFASFATAGLAALAIPAFHCWCIWKNQVEAWFDFIGIEPWSNHISSGPLSNWSLFICVVILHTAAPAIMIFVVFRYCRLCGMRFTCEYTREAMYITTSDDPKKLQTDANL